MGWEEGREARGLDRDGRTGNVGDYPACFRKLRDPAILFIPTGGKIQPQCGFREDHLLNWRERAIECGDWRRRRESNPRIAVLQTDALPLGYSAVTLRVAGPIPYAPGPGLSMPGFSMASPDWGKTGGGPGG